MVVSGPGIVLELLTEFTSQGVSTAYQKTPLLPLPSLPPPPPLPLPFSSLSPPPSRRFTKRIYIPLPSLEVSPVCKQACFISLTDNASSLFSC